MSLRLTVSISQKIGQPNYGSLGASCQVECELEQGLLQQDAERFQEAAEEVYAVCAQAVAAELSRLQSPSSPARLTYEGTHVPGPDSEAAIDATLAAEGNPTASRNGETSREARTTRPRFASPAQARAIRSMSQKLLIDLNKILWECFQVERVEELTVANASTLIQRLQAMVDRSSSS